MSGIYLGLTYEQKIFFAIWTILIYVIAHIITRTKNKAQKIERQQIIPQTKYLDLFNYVVKDKKVEFIGQNKVYKNELNRI